MGHVKLAEFQQRKDNLKTQYNEKVELIREKSSAGWSQAKETAMSAKEIAKESANKKAEAAIKKAELAAWFTPRRSKTEKCSQFFLV